MIRVLASSRHTSPFAVKRIALRNGASIAGLLVTTEAMVAEKPKKETPCLPCRLVEAWITRSLRQSEGLD